MDGEFLPEIKDPFQENASRSPQKNTRLWWIKTILLLLLVAVSIVMLFTLGDFLTGEDTPQLSFARLLQTIDYPLFILLLCIVLLYILVESAKYSYLLKVYTGKFRFRTAVKTMLLGKYYDGVTPLSTGGQPFQIYYLHKKNEIPRGAATAIPIVKYIVSIFFLTVLSITLLSVTPKYVETNAVNLTVLIISWISLALNLSLPAAIILFSVFPTPCKKVICAIVNLLHRFRIVKEPFKVKKKYLREMSEYSVTLKFFIKKFYKFLPLGFLCILESLLLVTIPFFVVIAIADVEPTLNLAIQIACLVIITRYTALLVPTPGNTGAAEAASSLVFVMVAGIGSVVGWVILVWRFLTYYMYILSGIGLNIFEIVQSAVQNKRGADGRAK